MTKLNIATKANRLQKKINLTEIRLNKAVTRKQQRQLVYELTTLEGKLENLVRTYRNRTKSSRYPGFEFRGYVQKTVDGVWQEGWVAYYRNTENNYRALVTRNTDGTFEAIAQRVLFDEYRTFTNPQEPAVVLERIKNWAESKTCTYNEEAARKQINNIAKLQKAVCIHNLAHNRPVMRSADPNQNLFG